MALKSGDGLRWYLARLRRMSPREVPYRLGQAVKKRIDSARRDAFVRERWPDTKPELVRHGAERLERAFPGLALEAAAEAERVCEHRFPIFGREVFFGHPIDWHLDPVSGKAWPLRFWGHIDYRGESRLGGIKFAWEASRLHHWPRLALAYGLTGKKRYLRELFAQLGSWLDANPYPLGIHWSSGIEIGLRIVNLTYALKYLAGELSDNERLLVGRFVQLHARHLYRYPSKHSSCANHAIAEALGLFTAGLCYPDLPGAGRWLRTGHTVLEREASRQIHADGSSFEHSVPYLQFVADHYIVYVSLCLEHGLEVSGQLMERLRSVADFLRTLMDSAGHLPQIGDEDDGYVLKLWFGEHNNYRSIVNTIDLWAGVRSRHEPDVKTLLLTGRPGGAEVPPGERPQNMALRARWFPEAGLAVVRSERPEMVFVGNSGPLGLPPMFGHGHADALSFWLSVAGQPVFVDPGTYLYQNGEPWRGYFRSTRAHNTVSVDGRDQAEHEADFMFSGPYRVGIARLESNGDEAIWTASHDGYARLADPVIHTRSVRLQKAHRLALSDSFRCEGLHTIESRLHLHPLCTAVQHGHTVKVACGRASLLVRASEKCNTVELRSRSESPRAGWYSPSFGQLVPTITIVMRGTVEGETTLATDITIEYMEVDDGETQTEERPHLHRRRVVHLR